MKLNYRQTITPAGNRRLAKKRVQCLIEALCFVSSSVLADSLVLRNPLLRQAPKRWLLYIRTLHNFDRIKNINDIEKNNSSNRYNFSYNIFAGTTAIDKRTTRSAADC